MSVQRICANAVLPQTDGNTTVCFSFPWCVLMDRSFHVFPTLSNASYYRLAAARFRRRDLSVAHVIRWKWRRRCYAPFVGPVLSLPFTVVQRMDPALLQTRGEFFFALMLLLQLLSLVGISLRTVLISLVALSASLPGISRSLIILIGRCMSQIPVRLLWRSDMPPFALLTLTPCSAVLSSLLVGFRCRLDH